MMEDYYLYTKFQLVYQNKKLLTFPDKAQSRLKSQFTPENDIT